MANLPHRQSNSETNKPNSTHTRRRSKHNDSFVCYCYSGVCHHISCDFKYQFQFCAAILLYVSECLVVFFFLFCFLLRYVFPCSEVKNSAKKTVKYEKLFLFFANFQSVHNVCALECRSLRHENRGIKTPLNLKISSSVCACFSAVAVTIISVIVVEP